MSEQLTVQNERNQNLATRDDRDSNAREQRWQRPRYDVDRLDSGDYRLRVWMPGVSKDNVNISLDGDLLAITGSRHDHVDEGWRPVLQELPTGDFRLTLTLNMSVDGDKIKGHIENGVLDLDLPVAEEAKPREIDVS